MKRYQLAVAALLVLGLGCHTAQATGPRLRTIAVHAPYTDEEASSFDGAQCLGMALTAPDCRIVMTGTSDWKGGTFVGGETYSLSGWPTADGKLHYEGPAYMTGTIVGCGKGTYIVDNWGGWIDFAKHDVMSNAPGGFGGSAPAFNYWRIRPGSGTGGLKGLVSGSGVNHWRDYAAGDAGLSSPEGIGLFTGTITCRTS